MCLPGPSPGARRPLCAAPAAKEAGCEKPDEVGCEQPSEAGCEKPSQAGLAEEIGAPTRSAAAWVTSRARSLLRRSSEGALQYSSKLSWPASPCARIVSRRELWSVQPNAAPNPPPALPPDPSPEQLPTALSGGPAGPPSCAASRGCSGLARAQHRSTSHNRLCACAVASRRATGDQWQGTANGLAVAWGAQDVLVLVPAAAASDGVCAAAAAAAAPSLEIGATPGGEAGLLPSGLGSCRGSCGVMLRRGAPSIWAAAASRAAISRSGGGRAHPSARQADGRCSTTEAEGSPVP